jgi:hypothetical protein
MQTELALTNTFEQSSFELRGVEPAENSAPAFLATALKNIGIEHSANAQVHSGKFSSISVQPIVNVSRNFVAATEDTVKPVEEISTTEVLTSEDELKNKALPPILSQHAITVLEKSTHSHDTFEKANEVFSEFIEEVEILEIPIEFATLGLEWGATGVEVFSHHAEALAHGLEKGAASFALIGLIVKMNKIHETFFEPKAEESHPSKLVSLGFSIVEVVCRGLSFLSKMGIISPALAAMGRLNLIGAFCCLVLALIDLGDNIISFTNAAQLLKALCTLAVAAAIVVLILNAASHLNVLQLILGTGIFILNVVIPEEELHAVKKAH